MPQASCVIASLPSEIAPAASSRCTTVALALTGARSRAPGGAARRVQAGDVEAVLPAGHAARQRSGVLAARGARLQLARALEGPLGVQLPDGAQVIQLGGERERALDPLHDSARGSHGVE